MKTVRSFGPLLILAFLLIQFVTADASSTSVAESRKETQLTVPVRDLAAQHTSDYCANHYDLPPAGQADVVDCKTQTFHFKKCLKRTSHTPEEIHRLLYHYRSQESVCTSYHPDPVTYYIYTLEKIVI